MKIINYINEKIGSDKIMHFLGGGWIVSIGSPFGWWGILIAFIVMLLLSVIKEKFLDEFFDVKDIIAACAGSGVSAILYLIITLII